MACRLLTLHVTFLRDHKVRLTKEREMLQKADSPYIAAVVGTRPEIVKLAPVIRLLGPAARFLHTGQHHDEELSGVFLAGARLPPPETLSGIGSEPRHVEAGLRSHDRAMPEEINRCVTGVLADLHCAPTEHAVANLRHDGVPTGKIVLTGNTIVEATLGVLPDDTAARQIAAGLGAEPGQYILATIPRPENTDDPERLRVTLDELSKLGLPVVFPLHPRTRAAAQRFGLAAALDRLRPVPPLDHRTFLGLARHARLLVSDSGGVQEECTVLKRPLIVVRNSTERQESVDAGFAHLVQPGPAIGNLGRQLISDEGLGERLATIPCPFGDGKASERIVTLLQPFLR